ncbi:hypothetical protein [Microbacterium trichothecenolyticum]|uniref:Thioester domain-containing protein n=1 Tax=Microbacterium trichothecenolyticum TaxID=69370 RepID=A0ABU0TYY3_MICTR|nr:hypothetical protein [Microbacterium trichothecenolyticum]MDQ1124865.1 hypothetical protein [Microbacterium trichothecenolyticum]
MQHPPPLSLRLPAILAVFVVLTTGLGLGPAAHAADRGTGFGTWAPLSRTGWHGSMRVGDVHTYCIHPGLPVATGTTTDHGVTSDVNGLSAQQLVSINHLVSTYGQTDDPVQAASVGWAVKAIVDRDTTLHSWGYEGDDLAGAIDDIMRRASPENSAAVQQRAVQYLTEAEAIRVPRVGGSLTLSTQEDDPTRGVLTVDVDAEAVGTITLHNAVFADTGSAERQGVRGGGSYPIVAPASAADDGRPYSVQATGAFSVRAAAIRFYSTPGQQESAGPAGPQTFELSTQDATPRPVRFSPRVQTVARIDGRRFVDEVTVSAAEGVWPRHTDGSFVVLSATADVYRTGAFPAEAAEVPDNLKPVAQLILRTDPRVGAGRYTVGTQGDLPGSGVYTAVWRIERTSQDPDVVPHLPPSYVWTERFASPTQTEQLVPAPPVDPVPAPSPTPSSTPTPVPASVAPPAPALTPPALPVTGLSSAGVGATSGIAAVMIGIGIVVAQVARRRRTPRV